MRCVDTGMGDSAANGRGCGANEVCDDGACVPCVAGLACTPTNSCHLGSTTCSTGKSTCLDRGVPDLSANGTPCGASGVCDAGSCACPAPDNCGTISDPLLGTISCGFCTGADTCGGGGVANVCGCTPLLTCPSPDNCGMISNGCGGAIDCGTCTPPQVCGVGGTPHVCGSCMPLTACPAPDNCGIISDGCGGTVNCGTCTGTQVCAVVVVDGGTAIVCVPGG